MTKQYFAITVEATLVVKTPMLVASGDQTLEVENLDEQQIKGAESRNTLLPCVGTQGYYIPASSQKGALKAFSENVSSLQHRDWIFGNEPQSINGAVTSQGGWVRFRNAPQKANVEIQSVTRNSINSITGATQQGHLFDVNAIKPGGEFYLAFAIPKASEDQLTELLSLLTAWGTTDNGLGRNTRNSQGQFELREIRVKGVEAQTYKTWLTQDGGTDLGEYTQVLPLVAQPITYRDDSLKLKVKLVPLSPIFVSDGKNLKGKKEEGHQSANAVKNSDGNYIIPSTSARGSFRSLGRKILLTLLQQQGPEAEATANNLLQVLFGGEKHASSITLTIFTAHQSESVAQAFIAIDRFTGGVKGGTQSQATAGANYTIEKPLVDYYLGEIIINDLLMKPENYAQLAIFLFVLRDLMQGEMLFGGLKGKGFGKAKAEIQIGESETWLTNWQAFEKAWHQQKLPDFAQLLTALQQQIQGQQTKEENKKNVKEAQA